MFGLEHFFPVKLRPTLNFLNKLNLIYLEISVGIIFNGIMSGDIMSVGIM